MSLNPDIYAELARDCAKMKYFSMARLYAAQSIQCRGRLVLVNGKWVPREGIMRDTAQEAGMIK